MEEQNSSESRDSLVDYWLLIRTHWWWIVAAVALALLHALAFSLLQEKVYSATARIHVEGEQAAVFTLHAGQNPRLVDNETEILKSQKILYPVIERLGLQQHWAEPEGVLSDFTQPFASFKHKFYYPLAEFLHLKQRGQREGLPMVAAHERLREQLSVSRSGNSNLMKVTVKDTDPQRAADIANTLVAVFDEARLKEKQKQMRIGIAKLREESVQQLDRMQSVQQKVQRLRKELNVPAFPGGRLNDKIVENLEFELAKARMSLVSEEVQIKELQRLDPGQRRYVLVASEGDPVSRKLIQDLTEADLRLTVLREGYGPDHPSLREATAGRDKMQQQFDAQVEGFMTSLEVRRKMTLATIGETQKTLDTAQKVLLAMDDSAYLPYKNGLREEEAEQRLYEAILTQLQKETVELNMGHSAVKVIDVAQPASAAIQSTLGRYLAVGAALGLLLGIGSVMLVDYFNTSLKKIEDVEKHLGVPVLGIIPEHVGLLSEGNGALIHAEVYRMLRSNLEFAGGNGTTKSFCFLSAGSGEGKSLTIANLAYVSARHGLQVLVVNCDLHRPSIENLLGTENDVGLVDFLNGRKTVGQIIRPTNIPNVSLIPTGTQGMSPSVLPPLTSEYMREIHETVGRKFDLVLYDTPPILAVSDAAIAARAVGTSVLIIQHRGYARKMEQRALKVIEKAGVKVLGVVVNRVDALHADLNHYYQSDYGSNRGSAEHATLGLSGVS